MRLITTAEKLANFIERHESMTVSLYRLHDDLLFGATISSTVFDLMTTLRAYYFFENYMKIQMTLVISTSLISNNRLSRSGNLVPA